MTKFRIVNYQPVIRDMPTTEFDSVDEARVHATWAVMTCQSLYHEMFWFLCCLNGFGLVWDDDHQLIMATADGQLDTVICRVDEI